MKTKLAMILTLAALGSGCQIIEQARHDSATASASKVCGEYYAAGSAEHSSCMIGSYNSARERANARRAASRAVHLQHGLSAGK